MNNQYLRSFLLVCVLLFAEYSVAQKTMNLEVGQMFSTFSFKDDIGTKEKGFSNMISGCYSLSYQQDSIMKVMFMRAGLGMRKGGASMILDGEDLTWNLQYVTAHAGVGYAHAIKRFAPYIYLAPYFGYLLKGKQMMGEFASDIVESKTMKTTDFGAYFAPGLKVTLSDYLSVFAEGKYVLGLQNLETDGQTLYNRGFSISLGASFSITKYKTDAEDTQKVLESF